MAERKGVWYDVFNFIHPMEAREQPVDTFNGQKTILFVDDEEGIVEIGELILKKLGYKVLTAADGREAIALYKEKHAQIDLVILDMIMPEMDGSDTFQELKKINPDIQAILSSGYSMDGQTTTILELGCKGFIQKPFGMQDLSAKVKSVLDRHDP
ncbi:MAG: response regulator [Desulfatitalea sp.]|nr:response regulator [Desulfatitalea sp.]NNJ99470.1 response regulator [Desulfatitalea sp.]